MVIIYVRDAGPAGDYADFFRYKASAAMLLKYWKNAGYDKVGFLVQPHQPDPAWPKIERLLRRNGWQPEQPLTYRQVQALAAWREVKFWWLPPENDQRTGAQPIEQPGARSGGQSTAKQAAKQGAKSSGQTSAQEGGQSSAQSAAQSNAQQGAQAGGQSNGQEAAKQGAKSGGQANGRSGARRNGYGTQGGNRRTRLWTPWPEPNKRLVRLAERTLQAVQVELVEAARESLPLSWNYRRLAVRQEMGQLDAGRRWERLGVPRLLIALDFSGSMGDYIVTLAALGAALAATFPWLVLAAAPNGEAGALTTIDDKQIIVDGKWRRFPAPKRPVRGDSVEYWQALADAHPVAAAIYVGDWEEAYMAEAFLPGRFGVLSVFRGSWGRPAFATHTYGTPVIAPTVAQCNSAEDFLLGLEMLVPVLLRNG